MANRGWRTPVRGSSLPPMVTAIFLNAMLFTSLGLRNGWAGLAWAAFATLLEVLALVAWRRAHPQR